MAKLYNNVTSSDANLTTGTLVTDVNRVSVSLVASNNEVKEVTLALRCDAGKKTVGDTTVSLSGASSAKWELWDKTASAYKAAGASLVIAEEITDKNYILKARVSSTNGEAEGVDSSVTINLAGNTTTA